MEFCHFPSCAALINKAFFVKAKSFPFLELAHSSLLIPDCGGTIQYFLNNDENRNRWNSIEA